MKKLILFWILILTFQVFAQNKNVALKFDEFTYPQNLSRYYWDFYDYSYESEQSYFYQKIISFDDRVIRFAQRIVKQKDSTAYIIFYNQRKGKYPLDKGETESQSVVRMLTNSYSKYPVSTDRIITIDGGFRETPTLEFWIVPKDAEPPKPSPTFSLSETAVCPEINIAGDGYRKDRSQPIKFSVAIKDHSSDSKFGLEWNVSAGKIIKGQNTNQIEVDLSGTSDKFISASVTVKGLHPECENHRFASTEVGFFPYKYDEFAQVPESYLHSRIDAFMSEIVGDPNMKGYIIIYGSRNGNKKDIFKMEFYVNATMKYHKFDLSRATIVNGGFREEMMVEFYLVPAGVEPPKPTPTLDSQFVVEPKKVIKKRKKTSK